MCLQVLNPCIQVFDIFAHDHHVDPFTLVARRNPWKFSNGANIGVRLKELAEGDVGALLTEANGSLEWALQGNARALDARARLLRNARRVALEEDRGASCRLLPVEDNVDARARCVEDALGGEGDLGSNPVARDQRDGVPAQRAHALRIRGERRSGG